MEWLARGLVLGASHLRASVRSLRLGFLLTVLVASTLCATKSVAQTGDPFDVDNRVHEGALLPPTPGDFREERVGKVILRFHPQDEGIAERLISRLPSTLRKVAEELGISPDQALEIRLARGPREMARLAPQDSAPPNYAVGVAYPALGLVILSVVDPQSWVPPNLEQVLTHEISHVLLHRAVGQQALPLWFVEGFAVHQAGEQRLGRIQVLWEAAIVDDVLPAASLSRRFPVRPNQVNLAYAQSADLVEHLLRSERDRTNLTQLLADVKAGSGFDRALLSTYHVDLAYLEREWKRSLGERYRVLPMVLTGTALWGGIALLVVIAFWRRRRDQREKLSRWAEEEAREEQAQAALTQPVVNVQERPLEADLYVVMPASLDTAVPTIEHEGQRYTLH